MNRRTNWQTTRRMGRLLKILYFFCIVCQKYQSAAQKRNFNSYLSQNISYKPITSFVIPKGGRRPGLTKSILFFLYWWKIVWNTILYMNFQYGWKPVKIQLILIGFEAILEKKYFIFCSFYFSVYSWLLVPPETI